MLKRTIAECIGTAWLVLGGCGSAVLAAAFPKVGIWLLGVSFAFGLTVLTMAYAIGHISGCHLNPGRKGPPRGGERIQRSPSNSILMSSAAPNRKRRSSIDISI